MKSFLEKINAGEVFVADGAMGSMLFERGLKPGDCPEELNLTHPEILEEIAKLYFEAGAEIVQTNTFGGSAVKLAEYGLEDKTEEINAKAVEAVRKSVGDAAYISGSCGPSGKILEPFGNGNPDEIYTGFERQVKGLTSGGVDIICVETMTDLIEASLAIKAAKSAAPHIPVMATMTFDKTPRGYFTIMGINIPQAIKGLLEAGADIIGSNCGNGIEKMIEIARDFRKETALPLIIQSNAGMPKLESGKMVYSESPEFFTEKIQAMKELNISVIGGCCGTTPDHIRAVKEVVKSWK
jgi:5-methyltetrahydrofolate--homocysteine methyltransferase